MALESTVFAGVDIASGRKPVTFAALDEDLNLLSLHKWTISEAISSLKEYETIVLAVNSSAVASGDFKKNLAQAGFKQVIRQGPHQWMDTDSQKNFIALCNGKLLSRRSVEGRIQRALILYDERLQIPDPMDFFEEITRHRLIQGSLPLENTYSAHELDALMAAYAAWIYSNEPRHMHLSGNRVVLDKTLED